jgi:hypothetical protein
MWHLIQHWLARVTGSENMPGMPPNYNFFSGSEAALVGAVIGGYRKHNCHERRCWRIGRHMVNGTPWCDRHHGKARER